MGAPVTRSNGPPPHRRDDRTGAPDWSHFESLFQASAPTLWCIAVSVVGDRTLADDVMQEAAMIAMRKFNEFDPTTNFSAWAGAIVRYVAMNAARKRARQRAVAASIDPVDLDRHSRSAGDGSAGTGIDQHGELTVDQGAFDDHVREALMELRPTARACLLLRTVLELPYNEIALALGIPEGTAMSHVHRSRAAMRNAMKCNEPAE